MNGHSLTLDSDDDGWDFATCVCGWVGPPCPDTETAADFFCDHLVLQTPALTQDLEALLTNASCIVENPWGAQWDGPCTGSHHIHIPCALAVLSRGEIS